MARIAWNLVRRKVANFGPSRRIVGWCRWERRLCYRTYARRRDRMLDDVVIVVTVDINKVTRHYVSSQILYLAMECQQAVRSDTTRLTCSQFPSSAGPPFCKCISGQKAAQILVGDPGQVRQICDTTKAPTYLVSETTHSSSVRLLGDFKFVYISARFLRNRLYRRKLAHLACCLRFCAIHFAIRSLCLHLGDYGRCYVVLRMWVSWRCVWMRNR